ncbi:MAG: ribosome maturation factor RimP [Chloracidobacterium sp.]|nr:ribosome maturation factor RimP [Chloracidobacterium sp.]
MDKAGIEERIRLIAKEAAAENDVEFVHCEVAGTKRNLTVRIFIDKPEGVNVEDCAELSRRVEGVLDSDDFIPSSYVLEVSSPGLERGIYSADEFSRFAGKKVKVKLSNAVNGQKVFVSRIVGVDGSDVILADKQHGEVRFPFSWVEKANLRVDLEEEFKKR